MQRTPSNSRLGRTGSNPTSGPTEPARNLQPKGSNVPFPEVSPIVSRQTPSVALAHDGALNDRGEQSARHSAAYRAVHGNANSTEHLDVQMGHEAVPVSVRATLLSILI